MKLIDSISSSINYGTTAVIQTVHKIATNPSAVKKVLQVAGKAIAGYDLYTGAAHLPDLAKNIKGTTDFIDFYGSFKDVVYWVNPFSKETIDQGKLEESILIAVIDHGGDVEEELRATAKTIFQEVMAQKAFNGKAEVLDTLKASLIRHGWEVANIDEVAKKVIVKQKSRPLIQHVIAVCFTVADVGGNLLVLQKHGIVDLAKQAAKLGTQFPILMFVMKQGSDTVLGVVISTGLTLSVGYALYRAIHNYQDMRDAANPEAKEKAYKELRGAIIDMISSGADLINAATPLLFTLNPPVVIGLAIFAKTTGVICILVR